MCSPAEITAEPVYEHRTEEKHKPGFGLYYIKLETHLPVSLSHRITQHSNKPTSSPTTDLQALLVQIKAGVLFHT